MAHIMLPVFVVMFALVATARAGIVEEYPSLAELYPDELYIKQGGTSWGEIFESLFTRKPFGKSFALVIGVSEYEGHFPPLATTRNDPIRMRDFLVDQAGFDFVITLQNARASKRLIETLMIDTLPKLIGDNDRFLFYFSGHGTTRTIQGAGKVGYLPLTKSGNLNSQMLSMQHVHEWNRLLHPVKQVLFLLDSCFSGLAGIQSMGKGTNQAIERLAARSHQLITAGTEGQQTIASDDWNGSVFTDTFLDAVVGGADTKTDDFGPDGVVSLAELMEYLGRQVNEKVSRIGWKYRISPQRYDLGVNDGQFFFITSEKKLESTPNARIEHGMPVVVMGDVEGKDQPSSLPTYRPEFELAFWNSIEDSKDPADFESYLERYPDGTFAGLARNRAGRLKPSETKDFPNMSGIDWDIDRHGLDFDGIDLPEDNPKLCLEKCRDLTLCKAWAYQLLNKKHRCWLKHEIPPPFRRTGFSSGIKMQ